MLGEHGKVEGLGFGLTQSCLQACSPLGPEFTLLSMGPLSSNVP